MLNRLCLVAVLAVAFPSPVSASQDKSVIIAGNGDPRANAARSIAAGDYRLITAGDRADAFVHLA